MIPKFRAWIEVEGLAPDENYMTNVNMIEWLSEDTMVANDSYVFNPHTNKLENPYSPAKLILMMSTGLFDKNGTEIYEDDKVINSRGEIGTVNYLIQESGFVVTLENRDYRLGHRNTGEPYTHAIDHEVIGNIFEGVK